MTNLTKSEKQSLQSEILGFQEKHLSILNSQNKIDLRIKNWYIQEISERLRILKIEDLEYYETVYFQIDENIKSILNEIKNQNFDTLYF